MNRYILFLAVTFSISLLSSCTIDNETQIYKYCVYSAETFCAEGPFAKCQKNGKLSNTCPYSPGSSPSSVSSSSSEPSNSSSSQSSSSSSSQSSSSSSSQSSSSSSSQPSSSSVAVSSSSSAPAQSGIVFGAPVAYEGETYQTVVIGTQTWFQRNLNLNVQGSRCFGDDSGGDSKGNCPKYGRLYDWATAMTLPSSCNNSTSCASLIGAKHRGICPSDWHIPSPEEFETLIDFVGGSDIAGLKLKAIDGWKNKNGEDSYGFSALPGGESYHNGGFDGTGAIWWSSSEETTPYNIVLEAYCMYINGKYDYASSPLSCIKSTMISVRCLKD
ncbi:MAG: hypothetical protein FWF63_05640 [Fibromonadales bacterium]|nr:hypothetical protein [Fibromonadales bacterium]